MNRITARTTLVAASLALLALGACSSTQETSSSTSGKTTITQAEKMYGEPSSVRYSPSGTETWTWDDKNMTMTFMDGVAVGPHER